MELIAADDLDEVHPELLNRGFDPVDEPISWITFGERLMRRDEKLKTVLMDQTVVVGIGTMYSDEILFHSGLRFDRITSSVLSAQEVRRLYRALVETVHEALKYGGTTLGEDGWVGLAGTPGDYGQYITVYKRDGEMSPRARSRSSRPASGVATHISASRRRSESSSPARLSRPVIPADLPSDWMVGHAGPLFLLESRVPEVAHLKGFKSFADTTQLELEPGVTVVVGPNGSGKSNVVDAIGWVLGAQAPSAVRSQKMDDVIFAGTAKRPALGRAEVSLTIDNTLGHPADRVHRGHHHPHAVPHRRQRVRHQRRAVPPARHPGAAVATPASAASST